MCNRIHLLDRSSGHGCCVVAFVARLMPGHPIARNVKASSRDGTTPSLPHMRHGVGNRRTGLDQRNAEIASEKAGANVGYKTARQTSGACCSRRHAHNLHHIRRLCVYSGVLVGGFSKLGLGDGEGDSFPDVLLSADTGGK